ncbi:hypothetical protein AMELA_G00022520 [Ameiurus melas]|uniref:Uncharacterized protein n=1 Tax=Ameiurus melas TaxID=219545 RepID=A0A7J6BC13_AMEME|nr:hypothetical protein AMELA_G00022520 [Ameiurus melas]
MCYPFRDNVEVDSLASKIATLFHLNSSEVEDEILKLQTDLQLKSRAHGQFWNLLKGEKYPNMSQPFPTWRLLRPNTVP